MEAEAAFLCRCGSSSGGSYGCFSNSSRCHCQDGSRRRGRCGSRRFDDGSWCGNLSCCLRGCCSRHTCRRRLGCGYWCHSRFSGGLGGSTRSRWRSRRGLNCGGNRSRSGRWHCWSGWSSCSWLGVDRHRSSELCSRWRRRSRCCCCHSGQWFGCSGRGGGGWRGGSSFGSRNRGGRRGRRAASWTSRSNLCSGWLRSSGCGRFSRIREIIDASLPDGRFAIVAIDCVDFIGGCRAIWEVLLDDPDVSLALGPSASGSRWGSGRSWASRSWRRGWLGGRRRYRYGRCSRSGRRRRRTGCRGSSLG